MLLHPKRLRLVAGLTEFAVWYSGFIGRSVERLLLFGCPERLEADPRSAAVDGVVERREDPDLGRRLGTNLHSEMMTRWVCPSKPGLRIS
jgi:hypothetical protein